MTIKISSNAKKQILGLQPSYNDYSEIGVWKIARSTHSLSITRYYNPLIPDHSWSIGGFIVVNDWDELEIPFNVMVNEIIRYEGVLKKIFSSFDSPRLFNRNFVALPPNY